MSGASDTDLKIDLPQTRIVIDRERVADLGLDLAAIGRDLAVMLSGGHVNRFNYFGRSYKVIPQVADSSRLTPDDLLQMKVRARDGGLVSVSSFVTLETAAAPRTLNRFQQRNSVKVYGGVAPGVTKEEALTALEGAARGILPQGDAIDYAGESRQLRQEGSSLAVTLGFALGLIYLVLAAQFGSVRDQLIVLLGSVPLAISGALVFSFLGWTTINIYSQVGLITLVGLVAKNGILIVEFVNRAGPRQACGDQGSRPHPIPADPDDRRRDRGRPLPARPGERRRRPGPQQHRHRAGKRDDHLQRLYPLLRPLDVRAHRRAKDPARTRARRSPGRSAIPAAPRPTPPSSQALSNRLDSGGLCEGAGRG